MLCLNPSQTDIWYWKPWRLNQIINPKTVDLRRMLRDPWLRRRALRRLLDDCFRIMGPQNVGRRACGHKWSHNHISVIHYSHKFSQLLLDSLHSCPHRLDSTVLYVIWQEASRAWFDYMKWNYNTFDAQKHSALSKGPIGALLKEVPDVIRRMARNDLMANQQRRILQRRARGRRGKKVASQKPGCT